MIDDELFGDRKVVKGVVQDLIDNYVIIIIVVVGSEVDFSGLESFILIDGFLMNIIFDEDLEKIGEEII